MMKDCFSKRKHDALLFSFLYVMVLTFCGCTKSVETMAEQPLFSIGLIADVQYVDREPIPEYNSYYRPSLAKLREAVYEFNSQDLAFVIQLGDLVDRDFESFDPVLDIWKLIKSPVYHVIGNHDLQDTASYEKVLGKLLLDRSYYDFKYQDWRFIVLNTCEISTFTHPEDSDEYKYAKSILDNLKEHRVANALPWNGTISDVQYNWLQERLDTAKEKNEKVVVLGHYPFLSSQPALTAWKSAKIVDLLQSYDCFKIYINGHDHDGSYVQNKGKHYLTLNGMMSTPDTNAYSVLDIYSNKIVLKGYGRVPSRVLKL